MSVAALIADMIRAGVDPDLIGRTVEAIASREPVLVPDEQAERRRAKDRERKRLRNSAESADKVSPKKETSPTPPKEKTTPSNSAPVFGARDFDAFWSLFPNKVGKRDAEKAFVKAVSRADPSVILAGLRRYVAKTDDRPWCNPATFLNQDRWEDAPAEAPPRQATAPPQNSINDAIDRVIRGSSDAPFASPTIDASYERTDRRGAQNLVQFDAAAARFRS